MLIIHYHLSLILQSQAVISWVVWATSSFALLCTVLMSSVITARLAIISAGPSTRLVHGSATAPLMSTAHQYFISALLLIVWLHHIYQPCLNTVLRTDLLPTGFQTTFIIPLLLCRAAAWSPHRHHKDRAGTCSFIVGNWSTKRWRSKQFASFECPAWDLWEVNFWVSALCDMRYVQCTSPIAISCIYKHSKFLCITQSKTMTK